MNKKDVYNIESLKSLIENQIINSYNIIDYGKVLATVNEHYIRVMINNFLNENVLINDDMITKNINYKHINVSNNGPGFDLFNTKNNKRYQVKFRQVSGKTPYSRQVHFETTRRKSIKNNNESAKTGHITYSINEFDYVIITLCHIKNGIRQNYKDWSFSVIPIDELINPDNESYCLSKIPKKLLEKYHISNISELSKYFM